VYESKDQTKLKPGHRAAIFGKTFRDFLNSKCVVGADGKTKEWKIWDADVDTAGAEPHWQAAMKRKRDSLPWLVISNHPKGGWEGPLPDNVEDATKLVEKYAGK
jgi:hypothetical protein